VTTALRDEATLEWRIRSLLEKREDAKRNGAGKPRKYELIRLVRSPFSNARRTALPWAIRHQ